MALKTGVLPLIGGAALLVGFIVFAWRRRPPPVAQYSDREPGEDVEPLSSGLERVPERQAIDLELDSEFEPTLDRDVVAPQSNEHASEYASDIRALFIARVTEALSPFPASPRAVHRAGKAS
ncbi:MAG: hypothetical protein ABJB12_02835 [Pseudomonadota bacterium]